MAGYEPLSAVDGQQALAELKLVKIDLLLLDLGLHVKNGWQAFEHIVSEHPILPVIVMTGQANQQFPAAEAGARLLMEKPLDAQRLLSAIQEFLTEPAEV